MPEQLTFNGIFRNRGAVQRQIRFCRTRAGHVHSMRQQIFPRTGIPGNQQRRRKICQLARTVDHMTHFRAHRNNLAECADVPLEIFCNWRPMRTVERSMITAPVSTRAAFSPFR